MYEHDLVRVRNLRWVPQAPNTTVSARGRERVGVRGGAWGGAGGLSQDGARGLGQRQA